MARRFRINAIIMSLLTTSTNILSAVLFHSLPDDPYHLAAAFAAYQHFASVLSLLGFVGAVREHAFSVSLFAAYLLLDTILATVPRFALLLTFTDAASLFCPSSSSSSFAIVASSLSSTSVSRPTYLSSTHFRADQVLPADSSLSIPSLSYSAQLLQGTTASSTAECMRVMHLLRAALLTAALAITFVQLVFALQVREYARRLMARERAAAASVAVDVEIEDDALLGREWKRDGEEGNTPGISGRSSRWKKIWTPQWAGEKTKSNKTHD